MILRRVLARHGHSAGECRPQSARATSGRARCASSPSARTAPGRASWRRSACAGRAARTPRRGPTGIAAKRSTLSLALEQGEYHDFVLVLAGEGSDREPPDPQWAWQGVEAEWHERIPELERTVAPRDARHAYAVLAGLTSSGGGMVAAATTSLPERARGGTQLRLSLRLDPRPDLRRPGGREGGSVCADGRRRALRLGASAGGWTAAEARLHDDGRSRARPAAAEPARLPRRDGHRRQLGEQAVPARRVRGGAAAVRSRGRP